MPAGCRACALSQRQSREASTRRLSQAPAPLTVCFCLGCRLRHSRFGVLRASPRGGLGARSPDAAGTVRSDDDDPSQRALLARGPSAAPAPARGLHWPSRGGGTRAGAHGSRAPLGGPRSATDAALGGGRRVRRRWHRGGRRLRRVGRASVATVELFDLETQEELRPGESSKPAAEVVRGNSVHRTRRRASDAYVAVCPSSSCAVPRWSVRR